MAKKITLGIVGIVLLAYVILPDPFWVFWDDAIAGVAGAAALLPLIKTFMDKQNKN